MTINDKNIVLFDMDDTLTPPRQKMSDDVVRQLRRLLDKTRVGIVSGSGVKYIQQQVPSEILSKMEIFPCNGTQKWTFFDGKLVQLGEPPSMREEIGEPMWISLMRNLHNLQASIMIEYRDLPYTSNFISDRDTMINWCPIGRNASEKERNAWIERDKSCSIRNWTRNRLILEMNGNRYLVSSQGPLRYRLGGQTSIDIFPTGWDKTYVLRHLPDLNVWFVGDKCEKEGNDYELYQFVSKKNQGFKVKSHYETPYVIENILKNF